MSLRLKTILGVAFIEAILLLLLVSMTLDYLRTTNYDSLVKRALTTVTFFSATTKDAILSYDLASLEAFVNDVIATSDILYARVLGPENELFASAGDPEILDRPFIADVDVEGVQDSIFDTYATIAEAGVVYGRVEIGLDIKALEQTISEAQHRSALIAGLEMGMVALFSLLLGTYLTRQLQVLTHAAKLISQGQLDISVPVKGKDEVAEVAQAFNAMASSLETAGKRRDEVEESLKELNRTLEARVSSRTKQIETKNQQLEQANLEIKSTQSKLLHSEKMASLGVLSAGVAHEINNPMGFIISNLGMLKSYAENYQTLVVEYEKFAMLEEPQARQEKLAEIEGLRNELDFEFMSQDIMGLLDDTQEGTSRVKEIVKDLKEFSHIEQDENYSFFDLNAAIQSTLKVVNNELKYHCHIETVLDDIPSIYGSAGQIKQVLLNLLVNAGQAIKDQGRIKIGAKCVNDQIVLTVEDTGTGINEEDINKLFDPFFTTKKVGEGTGLGLAISYGIIEKHGGEIRVESVVGEGTIFTIILPVVKDENTVSDEPTSKTSAQTAVTLNEVGNN